jgi:hypothetical protein
MTPFLPRNTQEDAALGARLEAPLTRFHRITAAILGLVVVSVCTADLVLSAPATPSSETTPTCDVPARTQDQFTALLVGSEIATPAATTDGQTLPEGVPADADTAAAMEQIVNLWLACQNAGEQLRAWSLFSDGYLYRLLSRQGGLSGEAYRTLATPAPVADEAAVVLAIEGERLLPDGRYGATVTLAYPSVPMPKRFFFFFTGIDGRLVIDGILGEISFSVP